MTEPIKCIHATNGIRTCNDGKVMLCCMSKLYLDDAFGKEINLRINTFDEALSGKIATEIRESLNNGVRHKNCQHCWDEEDAGVTSKRISDTRRFSLDVLDSGDIQVVELNLGTVCNLKCRICGPWASSQWNKDYFKYGLTSQSETEYNSWIHSLNHSYDDDSNFWKEIKNYASSIKEISIFGGEPFMVKKQWEFLEFLVEQGYSKDQILILNTNGTFYDEPQIEIINKFRGAALNISIDGIGAHFEYQRYPAKWEEVESNLRKFCLLQATDQTKISVCLTVNIYNIFYLDLLFRYFLKLGVPVYLNFLHTPNFFNVTSIPSEIKQKILKHYERITPEYRYYSQLIQVLDYMMSKESSLEQWEKFIEMTKKMDEDRKERFSSTFSEFAELINDDRLR